MYIHSFFNYTRMWNTKILIFFSNIDDDDDDDDDDLCLR